MREEVGLRSGRRRGASAAALAAWLAAAAPLSVQAQAQVPAAHPSQAAGPSARPAAEADADSAQPEVVVRARRTRPQPGAVIGDIKPEEQLGPADIQSYGVSTVTELLDELAPETRSDRGRGGEGPVVLLNGRRISGLGEIRNIPTEAIQRVDILPEEVSLKYGYTANQRVVNIVLRRRFRAITGEAGAGGPTEGGQASGQVEADLLHILRDDRLNLDLKASAAGALTEADRGLLSPAGDGTDEARFRTLLPATRSVTANAVLSRTLPWGVSGTANATVGATSSRSRQGLATLSLDAPAADPFDTTGADATVIRALPAFGPLRQDVDGWTAHLGSTLNRDLGPWRLSLTDAYDHADSTTRSDQGVDPAPLQALLDAGDAGFDPFAAPAAGLLARLPEDRARSRSDGADVQFLGNGPLLDAPAGQLTASVKLGDTESLLDTRSELAGLDRTVDLDRNDLNAQLSLDLPVASRDDHVLAFLGDLSLNVNGAVDELSDFGVLRTLGYGLDWTPLTGVAFVVSRTFDQAAPTQSQLGAPVTTTPGVRVLDFATGATVDVTRTDGGTSGLVADHRDVFKVGLTWKPLTSQQLSLTANFVKSRIDDPIATFPAATAEIEAAFPDRFTRDASGTLVAVDDRPVNFARTDREEIRWGFDWSRPIGPQPRRRFGGAGGGRGDRPRGEGGGRGGGSGRGGGGRGGGFGGGGFAGAPGGRLQLAIYHTLLFKDRMLVREGGPVFDLLNGSAAGSTGGQPRQEVAAQAGYTYAGFGARLSADWKSATTVRGGPDSPTGDLSFSDLATANFRLFANLGQMPRVVRARPWLRGVRVTLAAVNLFDSRVQVRDAAGNVPLGYQSAYLDPAGRTLRLSLRKLFF